MLRFCLSFAKVGIILLVIRLLPKYLLDCINWRRKVKFFFLLFSLFCYLICSSVVEFAELIQGTQRLWHDPPSLQLRKGGGGSGEGLAKANREAQSPVPWCKSCTEFQRALFSTWGNEMMECLKSRTVLGKWHNFFFSWLVWDVGLFLLQGDSESLGRNVASPLPGGECMICLPKALVAFNLSKRCKLGAVCQSKLSKWNNTRVAHTQTHICSPIPQTLILNWVRRNKDLG